MIPALLLLALGAVQTKDTVYRGDENKSAYDKAVEACKQAETLLTSSPEAAIEKLVPVFADVDKGLFKFVEQSIVIEGNSLVFKPHDFYPYNLRGRARLLIARKLKGEAARGVLIEAVNDFQSSLRKADRSREPLAETLKELWDNVRAALAYQGWTPGRTGQLHAALALLASPESAEWLGAEVGKAEAHLSGLRKSVADLNARRPPAGLAAEWCEAVGAAVRGIPAFESVQAAAARTGLLAASIRDAKGTFRLKIGVNPWAKVRLMRNGEEIPLADRDTPLFIPQELEIDEYTVELVHSNQRKNVPIPAKSLEHGRTYVLWGDMSGDKFEVSELLK